ncbi:alpha/beta fold hydrolase [Limibacter armeniacum]|uniref:alpha/beta fold hydrolase n=1 Tax=Limibacter armeniacum TaxID=466084 RepID=UPI002FE65E3A
MSTIQTTSHFIPLGDEQLHLKRIWSNPEGAPVLMIHGSIESGNIFYSKSMKGLAPYLAKQGLDVYVADLRGRGLSTPTVSRQATNTQQQAITEEIPAFVKQIQQLRGTETPIHAIAHSWGGVLLLAYLARFPQASFESMVFLATKRSISVRNLKKYFAIDLMWNLVGRTLTSLYGFLPAIQLKIGSANESANVYSDCRKWVYSLYEWKGVNDGFDYLQAFKTAQNIPPTLYMTGINEFYLGHQDDVKRLMKEVDNPTDKFMLLSKTNGHKKDYGHIDICTAKEGTNDHFPIIRNWMVQQKVAQQ